MKTLVLSTLFFFSAFVSSAQSSAAIHNVSVNSNNFSPSTLTDVQVGDIIRWTLNGGSHTTTSVSIPAGAATWDYTFSGAGDTFDYTVTEEGTYTYECRFHGGMTGSFATSLVGLSNQNSTIFSTFPVPFNDFIIINHPVNTGVKLIDTYGRVIFTEDASSKEVTGIDTYHLDKGIYILILKNTDGTVTTKKVLKN